MANLIDTTIIYHHFALPCLEPTVRGLGFKVYFGVLGPVYSVRDIGIGPQYNVVMDLISTPSTRIWRDIYHRKRKKNVMVNSILNLYKNLMQM